MARRGKKMAPARCQVPTDLCPVVVCDPLKVCSTDLPLLKVGELTNLQTVFPRRAIATYQFMPDSASIAFIGTLLRL